MSEPSEKSFWSSLSKVLTAVAALVTAVGGLLVGLGQLGVFDDEDEPPETRPVEDDSGNVMDPGVALLPPPVPRLPECNSPLSVQDGLSFRWEPVEGASTYTVEVDCFRCQGRPEDWYSRGGEPWHVRTGLGLRSPIWTRAGDLLARVRRESGLAIRWRVWAIDQDGIAGEQSDWCQIGLGG